MRRAFLFDVDATLVRTGGVGSRSLAAAFHARLGVAEGLRDVRLHGRTDFAIVREMFVRAERRAEATADNIRDVLDHYLPLLRQAVAQTPDYRVLPGAVALLEALRLRGHILGLATGNIEAGARLKLARGGLDGFFPFGGFGDDAEERGELVRAARGRAEEAHGGPLRDEDIFVVGDSELDVAAAHAARCQAVAVGTGLTSEAELREAGAHYYFATLEGAQQRAPFSA